MPRVRTPPCGFGISPLRTACAMYSLAHSARLTFVPGALSHGFNSATLSPSTPGAPALAPRAHTRPACCCVPPRLPSAVMLPVSFAPPPPPEPLHPHPIPASSPSLRRRGPHSRALLLAQLASRSAVLLPCLMFGPSP